MCRYFCVFVVCALFSSGASALNITQLMELKSAVIEICRGGLIEGNTSRTIITGTATGKIIVIKRLMEGGVDAHIELTNEEWKGIKVLANPEGYTECVDRTLDKFVKLLKS